MYLRQPVGQPWSPVEASCPGLVAEAGQLGPASAGRAGSRADAPASRHVWGRDDASQPYHIVSEPSQRRRGSAAPIAAPARLTANYLILQSLLCFARIALPKSRGFRDKFSVLAAAPLFSRGEQSSDSGARLRPQFTCQMVRPPQLIRARTFKNTRNKGHWGFICHGMATGLGIHRLPA